jgi:uncharacterized protein (DUF433 family)
MFQARLAEFADNIKTLKPDKGDCTMPVAEKKTNHPFITLDPKLSGGQPIVRGTRIKVMDIAIRYELMGMSADKIVDEYPHLRLEQIHDALSYYYEHKTALDKKYKDEQSFLAQLKKQYPSKLRAKLA